MSTECIKYKQSNKPCQNGVHLSATTVLNFYQVIKIPLNDHFNPFKKFHIPADIISIKSRNKFYGLNKKNNLV